MKMINLLDDKMYLNLSTTDLNRHLHTEIRLSLTCLPSSTRTIEKDDLKEKTTSKK